MSCVDPEGVKTDLPDFFRLNPKISAKTFRIRMMVLLHLGNWSYRKIGKAFNVHHERVREIIASSGLSKSARDRDTSDLGRETTDSALEVDDD